MCQRFIPRRARSVLSILLDEHRRIFIRNAAGLKPAVRWPYNSVAAHSSKFVCVCEVSTSIVRDSGHFGRCFNPRERERERAIHHFLFAHLVVRCPRVNVRTSTSARRTFCGVPRSGISIAVLSRQLPDALPKELHLPLAVPVLSVSCLRILKNTTVVRGRSGRVHNFWPSNTIRHRVQRDSPPGSCRH